MPLAALTPVLNDLLHKGGGGGGCGGSSGGNPLSTNVQNPSLQTQLSNPADTPTSSEYPHRSPIFAQSTSIASPLTSSSIDDVSI